MQRKILTYAIAAMAAALMSLSPGEISDMVLKADLLEDEGKYEESNKILFQVLKADPGNKDACWMIARNYYNLGEEIPHSKETEAKKLAYYEKCKEWSQKSIDNNPQVAEGYFYLGTGISSVVLVQGIARNLNKFKEVENLWLKTLDMHPTYSTPTDNTQANADFALCQYYRKAPESSIMKLLFGTRGDLDKAVKYCGEAVKILPNRIDLVKEMGVVLTCRGVRRGNQQDIDAGKKWLAKTKTMEADTKIDRIDQEDAQRIMDNPKLACGYSRVQQEEVTEVKK